MGNGSGAGRGIGSLDGSAPRQTDRNLTFLTAHAGGGATDRQDGRGRGDPYTCGLKTHAGDRAGACNFKTERSLLMPQQYRLSSIQRPIIISIVEHHPALL